ncbi:50S ribosomal protein L10 [Candidatus Gottesmanbacteria bacterium RBG_16_37_8]|uniref:Large ribosomal subunit protein uL10 n=1 Tax=Candidatus Gottesmanbacteria bacterium RBG_16_37_8 TaxID=1798371 RepID=A0A1F5YVB6_9BACT|nr:MAG: 50S ribosomal protein L10 [Candidatus Gottesmanbacteria bacterium RBG_16_37_8]
MRPLASYVKILTNRPKTVGSSRQQPDAIRPTEGNIRFLPGMFRGFFMKKSKPNLRKAAIVDLIKTKIDKAKAIFLTDYKGLTHKQLEDLRKNLKTVEAEYVVVKNTLLKISLADKTKKDELVKMLKDSTAVLFAYGDELSAIKKLADFAKNFSLPKIKIGFMSDTITSQEDFLRLASLPSKEVLLATLVYRLKSPITGFHYALSWNLRKFVTVLNNIKGVKV